jgi:hypothetical protein
MKKAGSRRNTSDDTPIAIAAAAVFGCGAFYCAEIIYGNINDTRPIQEWPAHWSSACVASVVFVVGLYLLESLGRRSKVVALRSAAPWLPIIGITGLATAVHLPVNVVVMATR